MSHDMSLFNYIRTKMRKAFLYRSVFCLIVIALIGIVLALYIANVIVLDWAILLILIFSLFILLFLVVLNAYHFFSETNYKRFLEKASKIDDLEYLDKTLSQIPNHHLTRGMLRYNEKCLFYYTEGGRASIIALDEIKLVEPKISSSYNSTTYYIRILTTENENILITIKSNIFNYKKNMDALHSELSNLKRN